MLRTNLFFVSLLLPVLCFAQTRWESVRYDYSVEIPKDYKLQTSISANADFTVSNGKATIAIVVKTIPDEYASYSIWEILGDLETFGEDWEAGAIEFMDSPKFIKCGKTLINEKEAFWFDNTLRRGTICSKNYQIKKGAEMYSITMTCRAEDYEYNKVFWLRFKNKIRI